MYYLATKGLGREVIEPVEREAMPELHSEGYAPMISDCETPPGKTNYEKANIDPFQGKQNRGPKSTSSKQ